ncbi:TlpA disulfide reductase family protein [Chitinophaga silvisoli]|uniref:AhpC/TSA family protein n=1 Tax=Chitinophaga silvisoli TaxID=2291814 RepID=A0A3E1NVJ0_9BACT|nr:TlpA disulfide reductase family protein [Chitinophaga silvisoli]RFM31788.1 AhpC/TSA family protein [Chitinophaga silvisoli]
MPFRYCSLPILTAGLLFLAACRQTPSHITISGHIEGLEDSILYLGIPKEDAYDTFDNSDYYDSEVIRYVPIKNGSFSWSQSAEGPRHIVLKLGAHRISLFTGNTDIQIQGGKDSLGNLRITGSAPQQEFEAFKQSMAKIWKQERYLGGILSKVSDTNYIKEITPQYDAVVALHKLKTAQFIADHPGSIVSVALIRELTYDGDPTYLDSLFHLLTPEVLTSREGKYLQEKIGVLKRGAVGQVFRDFVQTDENGDTVRLADFKGKYLLIYYWEGYGKEENLDVLRLYNCYKKMGFTVLGVFMGEDKAGWKDVINYYGLPWKQVSDLEGMHGSLAREYGIIHIPNNFLLDPKGVIIGRSMSMEELEKKLCEIGR